MRKIKDRIFLGIITGIIAGVPGRLLNAWEHNNGQTDIKYGHMASSLFIPKEKTNTTEGKIIGSITNHINISLTGVLVTYLLSATGRDKAIIKGLGVSSVAWLAIYGLSSRLGVTAKNKKPLSPILSFIDHLTLGGLSGLIVSKLGDDALFPDNIKTNNKEKIPLIATNSDTKDE